MKPCEHLMKPWSHGAGCMKPWNKNSDGAMSLPWMKPWMKTFDEAMDENIRWSHGWNIRWSHGWNEAMDKNIRWSHVETFDEAMELDGWSHGIKVPMKPCRCHGWSHGWKHLMRPWMKTFDESMAENVRWSHGTKLSWMKPWSITPDEAKVLAWLGVILSS